MITARTRNIAIVINKIRVEQKISQRKLAVKAGIHESTIARVESQLNDCYSLQNLLKIADVLKVPLHQILKEAGE